MLAGWKNSLEKRLWRDDLSQLSRLERAYFSTLRIAHVLLHDISDPQFTLRAMGLVYTSLLSLVPLLALSFSLLKAFGVHNLIEPTLKNFLAPLGPQATELSNTIISFVENIKVGVLGSIGLGLLLYAAISLIQKLESGLNFVWQVQQPRSLARRFSEYLSVLIVGPVVVVSALGLTATVLNNNVIQHVLAMEPFGTLYVMAGKLLPYFLISLGFGFLYFFIPNTRVRLLAALIGGLFAGVLWQTASWLFAKFAASASNYNAIYSGFAILIFLLIWLYVVWLVTLLGAHVAFLLQRPEHLARRRIEAYIGGQLKERTALLIMGLVTHAFIERQSQWNANSLVKHLQLPPRQVYAIIDLLIERGFLAETGDDQLNLLPGRDPDTTSVTDILKIIRESEDNLDIRFCDLPPHVQARDITEQIEASVEQSFGHMTLRDLAGAGTPAVTAN